MSPKSGAVRNDVLLVESLPFDTAEEAFLAAAEGLRGHVGWLPDGEVAERVNWVGMLHQEAHDEIHQATLAPRAQAS